jgi:hypothetical protein
MKRQSEVKYLPDLSFKYKFLRNGTMNMIFNQPVKRPPFGLINNNETDLLKTDSKRSLVSIEKIDAQRDMLKLRFDCSRNIDLENFSHFVSLTDWQADRLVYQFNFSDPMYVSLGNNWTKCFSE